MEFLNLLYKCGAAAHITTGYVMSDHAQPSVFDNCSVWPFESWFLCVPVTSCDTYCLHHKEQMHILNHNSYVKRNRQTQKQMQTFLLNPPYLVMNNMTHLLETIVYCLHSFSRCQISTLS